MARLTLCMAGISLILLAFPLSAGATKRCRSTSVSETGLTLRANDVRTFGGTSCKVAHIVVRRYFQAVIDLGSGCAQRRAERGCTAYGYTCITTEGADGAPSRGRCVHRTSSRRVVRFLEVEALRAQ
jgi:hypothetical protein